MPDHTSDKATSTATSYLIPGYTNLRHPLTAEELRILQEHENDPRRSPTGQVLPVVYNDD